MTDATLAFGFGVGMGMLLTLLFIWPAIRWQVETTYMDMMQKAIIQRYKNALETIAKAEYSAECAAIAETALRPT